MHLEVISQDFPLCHTAGRCPHPALRPYLPPIYMCPSQLFIQSRTLAYPSRGFVSNGYILLALGPQLCRCALYSQAPRSLE
jgi:hypothetical protein